MSQDLSEIVLRNMICWCGQKISANTLVVARGIPGDHSKVYREVYYSVKISIACRVHGSSCERFLFCILSNAFSKRRELESQLQFPLPSVAPLTTDIQKKLSWLTTCLSGAVKLPRLFDEERTVKKRIKSSQLIKFLSGKKHRPVVFLIELSSSGGAYSGSRKRKNRSTKQRKIADHSRRVTKILW